MGADDFAHGSSEKILRPQGVVQASFSVGQQAPAVLRKYKPRAGITGHAEWVEQLNDAALWHGFAPVRQYGRPTVAELCMQYAFH